MKGKHLEEKILTGETPDLDLLFKPRSLAVIGISRDPGRGGGFIWWKIQAQGYPGEKYPVSRSCTELDGLPCYASLSAIEGPVDLVIAALPAAAIEGLMAECAQKRVKFVVIHAAGFSELGEEGKGLQERVLEIARRNEIRLVGPNCMGIFCPESRLNTIVELEESDALPGGVAFSGQSGWATEHFVVGGNARGLRFSKVISSGNQADLNFFDFLSYFGNDPSTKVICAYIEGLSRGREVLKSGFPGGSHKTGHCLEIRIQPGRDAGRPVSFRVRHRKSGGLGGRGPKCRHYRGRRI